MADVAPGSERVLVDPSLRERVLLDPALDERLARNGIVAVPMLGPEELRAVEAAFWNLVPPDEGGIRLDYLREDRDLVAATSALLTQMWARVVPEVFAVHYPVYSSFVVKYPGEDSSLHLHRDLCVDDERQRRTFAMWMPFVDTGPDLDNGPLAFVEGSQDIRHGGFGPNAAVLFSPYEHHLRERLRPVSVSAGTALVYDARMLHASEPNHTPTPRLAVGCLLARRDQPVIQVVATGRRHRRIHQVDDRYFVDHPPAAIAMEGMPDAYPVLEEYDEEPGQTAAEILGPDLAPVEVDRMVIVPQDLELLAGRRRPLPMRLGRPPGHASDLRITAADLPPAGAMVAGDVACTGSGAVGALDLTRRWRRSAPCPPVVPDVVAPLRAPATRNAALVVVDPGARLTLNAPEPDRYRREVVVVEATPVRSGACAADEVADAQPGARIPLLPDHPLHLWNEGPGPLVVVVRSGPGRRRALAVTPRSEATPEPRISPS